MMKRVIFLLKTRKCLRISQLLQKALKPISELLLKVLISWKEKKKDEIEPDLNPVTQRKILQYNLEKTFNDDDKKILKRLGYPLPNKLLDADPDELKEIYNKVTNDAKKWVIKLEL